MRKALPYSLKVFYYYIYYTMPAPALQDFFTGQKRFLWKAAEADATIEGIDAFGAVGATIGRQSCTANTLQKRAIDMYSVVT